MGMTRTFHPVGQGAFYSEKFETRSGDTFTIVYDCGSTTLPKKLLDRKIKTAFPKDSEIDILFISHFHADHINGIETLKKHCQIKTVILPELASEAKALLKTVYFLEKDSFDKLSYEEFEQLIENPVSFFGEERTQIITIEPVEGELQSNDEQLSEPIDISRVRGNRTFPSATTFSHPQVYPWLFIPFNYKQEERRKQFEDAIAAKGIKLESLNDISAITKQKELIKKAYKSIDGDLNENSMILYSGPKVNSIFEIPYLVSRSFSRFCFHCCPSLFQAGCLYTGDIDWTVGNLFGGLSKFLNCIGTIQIPHHGSRHNFDRSLLDLQELSCTIFSFGSNNTYGHPADSVVEEVVQKGILPCFVTEDPSSIVVQHIE